MSHETRHSLLCIALTVILSGFVTHAAAAATAGQGLLADSSALVATGSNRGAALASDIEALTGEHTKIVWCHANTSGGGEPVEEHHEIRVFDTREGIERQLVPNSNFHFNPIITPSGNEVVYNEGMIIGGVNGNSNVSLGKTRVITWAGTGARDIGEGIPVFVWKDPATSNEWVYVSSPGSVPNRYENDGPLVRYRISDPSIRETAYQPGYRYSYYIGMSRDGSRIVGQMIPPDPTGSRGIRIMQDPKTPASAGLFTNPVYDSYPSGFCSSSFAPDNSYYYFHFNQCHCALHIFDRDKKPVVYNDTVWKSGANSTYVWVQPYVNPSRPIPDDNKSWSVKFSNNSRFLTTTSYSSYSRDSGNIHIGRFNATMTGVEKWVQVTTEFGYETHSYAWIAPNATSVLSKAVLTPQEDDTFVVGDTISITWQFDGSATNTAIEVSYDSGLSWRQVSGQAILATQPPVYQWVAPEALFVAGLGQVPLLNIPLKVRVREYESSRLVGESGIFTIRPETAVKRGRGAVARRESMVSIIGTMLEMKPGVRDLRLFDSGGRLLLAVAGGQESAVVALPRGLAPGMYVVSFRSRNTQNSSNLVLSNDR